MKATGAALVAKKDLKEPISILVMVSACCARDCSVATSMQLESVCGCSVTWFVCLD